MLQKNGVLQKNKKCFFFDKSHHIQSRLPLIPCSCIELLLTSHSWILLGSKTSLLDMNTDRLSHSHTLKGLNLTSAPIVHQVNLKYFSQLVESLKNSSSPAQGKSKEVNKYP